MSHLKYRIKYLYDYWIKPTGISEKAFIKELGIPKSTYQKDKQTKINETFSMPEERLQRYSLAFGVVLSDVLNYKVEQKRISYTPTDVHIENLGLSR